MDKLQQRRRYNYKNDVCIDSSQIEKELCNQSSLFMDYAELYADAVQEKDRQKQQLDLLYAELDAEVRDDWQSHFSKRPTESKIKVWISVHPKYVQAQKLYIEACRDVNITQGARDAFSQRRSILQSICALKIAGIYSEPKSGGDTKRALAVHKGLSLKKR